MSLSLESAGSPWRESRCRWPGPETRPDGWWIMMRECGQRVALALGAGREQERAHRGRLPHADGRHSGLHVLHGVVDREAGRDRAARRVDVEDDVLVGVFGLEEQHLGDDDVGDVVVDRRAEEDDAVLEQARVDVVAALAAVGLLDDRRDDEVVDRGGASCPPSSLAPGPAGSTSAWGAAVTAPSSPIHLHREPRRRAAARGRARARWQSGGAGVLHHQR